MVKNLKSNAGNPGLSEEAGIEERIGLLKAEGGRSVCRFRFLTVALFTLQAVRIEAGCEGQNCEDNSESVAQKAVEKTHGFALKHFNQFTKQAEDRKARRGEAIIPFIGLTDIFPSSGNIFSMSTLCTPLRFHLILLNSIKYRPRILNRSSYDKFFFPGII
eukprot:g38248.t1